jgi:hypothetical protein
MRPDARALVDLHMRADQRIGSDFDIVAKPGLRIDQRARMDACHRSLGPVHTTQAGAKGAVRAQG